MPARVIRGEINSSDSLSRVSIEADLTFRALLVAVDDYGRFDARMGVLKAALFPLRDEMTPKRIERALAELEGVGCLRRYESGGRAYLCLPNWERHRGKGRRGNESRYPEPTPPSETQRGASAEILGSECGSADLPDRVEGREARDEGREARVRAPRAARSAPRTPPPESWPDALREPLIRRLWRTRPHLLLPEPPKPHCTRAWIYAEAENCLDWHRKEARTAADWVAAAANWIAKSDARQWPEGLPRAAPLHDLAARDPDRYLPRELRTTPAQEELMH